MDIKDTLNILYNSKGFLLTDGAYKPGKKPYRNLYRINEFMKIFIEEGKTSIDKYWVIDNKDWGGPSTYIQNARTLTNFNLVEENWKGPARRLTLNTNGLTLLEKYKKIYPTGDIPNNELPDFVIDYFLDVLKKFNAENATLWTNTIICAVRQLLNTGYFFVGTSGLNDEEYQQLIDYYNYEGDLTFLEWVKAYLENLNLINEVHGNRRIRKYQLNDKGKEFVISLAAQNNVKGTEVFGMNSKSKNFGKEPRGYGSGGESQRHKNLKLFIRDNPDRIGIRNVVRSMDERYYPTHDHVDVWFEDSTGTKYVVEIELEDDDKLLIGAKQLIKYRALEAAEYGWDVKDPRVKAILVAYSIEGISNKIFCNNYNIKRFQIDEKELNNI
jgi:hypothetical protein